MAHEAPRHIPDGTAENSTSMLWHARQEFDHIRTQPALTEFCRSYTDHYGQSSPAYWQAAADFTHEPAWKDLLADKDERTIALITMFLVAPAYIYARAALEREQYNESARQQTSSFNANLRHVGITCPNISAASCNEALVAAAWGGTITERPLCKATRAWLWHSIRGVQYELAFEQMLLYTKRRYSRATQEQDLQGIDYFVETREDDVYLMIDVKGPYRSIVSKENNYGVPYGFRSNGIVLIRSLVEFKDFGNQFFVPDELAAKRAITLDGLLDEIDASTGAP